MCAPSGSLHDAGRRLPECFTNTWDARTIVKQLFSTLQSEEDLDAECMHVNESSHCDDVRRTDTRVFWKHTHVYIYTSMAGKKNTTTRGGKRGAKPEDEDEEEVEDVEDAQEVEDPQRGEPRDDDDDANDGNVDGEEDVEDAEDGEGGDGMEDRDDGGATAGRIPRDAAVVRDILKSMVRI